MAYRHKTPHERHPPEKANESLRRNTQTTRNHESTLENDSKRRGRVFFVHERCDLDEEHSGLQGSGPSSTDLCSIRGDAGPCFPITDEQDPFVLTNRTRRAPPHDSSSPHERLGNTVDESILLTTFCWARQQCIRQRDSALRNMPHCGRTVCSGSVHTRLRDRDARC